ncbi:MAG: zinc dependent phospholipase C family protein [Sarcina sp.]
MIDIEKTKKNINNMFVHRSKKHKHKSDELIEEILLEALKRAETHDVIFYQAYHISLMDNSMYLKNSRFEESINWYVDLVEFHDDISKSIKRIRPSYSKMPDRSFMSTLYLFADHFYNYETEKNYLRNKRFTAMSRFKKSAKRALRYKRRGKRLKAMESLCYACHFLADMNEPHHVGNQIDRRGKMINFLVKVFNLDGIRDGVFSNHGSYEAKVKKWIKNRDQIDKFLGKDSKETFLLDNVPIEGEIYDYLISSDLEKQKLKSALEKEKVKFLYNKNRHLTLDEYCEYIGRESAKYAVELVEDTKIEESKEQISATIKALNMTQVQLARFLYYFVNLD